MERGTRATPIRRFFCAVQKAELLAAPAQQVAAVNELLEQIALAGAVVWQWGQLPNLDKARDWKGWRCILAHPRIGASPEVFDSGEGASAEEALTKAWANYCAGASEFRRWNERRSPRKNMRSTAEIAADLGIDLDDLFS